MSGQSKIAKNDYSHYKLNLLIHFSIISLNWMSENCKAMGMAVFQTCTEFRTFSDVRAQMPVAHEKRFFSFTTQNTKVILISVWKRKPHTKKTMKKMSTLKDEIWELLVIRHPSPECSRDLPVAVNPSHPYNLLLRHSYVKGKVWKKSFSGVYVRIRLQPLRTCFV